MTDRIDPTDGADRYAGLWRLAQLALALVYLYRTLWVVWPYLAAAPGDFFYYYRAGGELAAGHSPFLHHFDYPPLIAFLALPFSAFPFGVARLAWYLMSQAALLGAAWALVRPLGGGRAALLAVAAVWAFAGTVQENLVLGQVQPLLLLLVTLAWRWQAERPGWAAAMLGLAAAVKIWPGLLLAVFLRRPRALAAGLGTAFLGVALPTLLLVLFASPPHAPTSHAYWMGSPAALNFSLPALGLKLADRPADLAAAPPADWQHGHMPSALDLLPARRALSVGISLFLLAAGLAALARVAWARDARPWDLAVLTALALLASPISWYHYQIFALPALALLAAKALGERRWSALAGVALVGAGLTSRTLRDLLWGLWGHGAAGSVLAAHAAVAGCNLVLLVWLLRRARHSAMISSSR